MKRPTFAPRPLLPCCLIALLAGATAGAVPAGAAQAPLPPMNLHGFTLDAEGAPIANVTFEIRTEGGPGHGTAQSTHEGWYVVNVEGASRGRRLTFHHGGTNLSTASAVLFEPGASTRVNLTLPPEAPRTGAPPPPEPAPPPSAPPPPPATPPNRAQGTAPGFETPRKPPAIRDEGSAEFASPPRPPTLEAPGPGALLTVVALLAGCVGAAATARDPSGRCRR